MFDPNDWTGVLQDHRGVPLYYKNVDTLLLKQRKTFSHKQQKALRDNELKIFLMSKKQ